MRQLRKSPIPFYFALDYTNKVEDKILKYGRHFVADILLGLGINKDQVEAILKRYRELDEDTPRPAKESIDSQNPVNLIADLYGEHLSEGLSKDFTATTPQSAADQIRLGKKTIHVDLEKCNGCRICLTVCSRKAFNTLSHRNIKKFVVNLARCSNCGKCLKECPQKAIFRK